MKKYRKTLTVLIILVVALIMCASFFGVYKKNENGDKVNILPNYNLGMELSKTRVITATVNDEVITTIYDAEGQVVEPEEGVEYTEEAGYKTVEQKVNEDSAKTVENYNKTKKIIEERLEKSGESQFFVDVDETTGKIEIQIPEDENAVFTESFIKNSGSLMLLDGESFEVVLDSTNLQKAEVMYSQGDFETAVFLQIGFNEEGTKKLQELNNIYVETTKTETNEAGEEEEVTESKVVWVILNDAFIGSTVLPNIVYDNKIVLTFGVSNDNTEIQTAAQEAEKQAILLNSGTAPLVYDYSNEIKETNITPKIALIVLASVGALFGIAYIYLIIKFKARGFISIYFQVGFLAILLLILRLTSVVITMEGIVGIVVSMVLEYMFTYIVLKNLATGVEGMYKESNLTFFLRTLPIYVVAVVFTFGTRANISSFGTTLFWGILMVYVYNFIFSKFVFENLKMGGQHENS